MSHDPYSPVLVLGVAALVRDAESPDGVRFAVLGSDAPQDCVQTVDELPDSETSLRVFSDRAEAAAYAAGVAEHGGNAVSAQLGHDRHGTCGLCVLIVRHDRPRRAGTTLDEAVTLRSGFADDHSTGRSSRSAADFAEMRQTALNRHREGAAAAALAHSWKTEIETINRTARLRFEGLARNGNHLKLDVEQVRTDGFLGFSDRLELVRDGGGLRARQHFGALNLDADLAAKQDAAVAALGVTVAGKTMSIPMAELGLAEAERAVAAFKSVRAAQRRLGTHQDGRAAVAAASANKNLVRVLQRTAAGCVPIILHGTGAQLSPRSGTAQQVACSLLRQACGDGWLRPVWGVEKRDPLWHPTTVPEFFGLTEAGLALVEGRTDDAAGEIAGIAERFRDQRFRGRIFPDNLGASLIATYGPVTETDAARLRAHVAENLPDGDFGADAWIADTQLASDTMWCCIAAGLLIGAVVHGDTAKTFRRAEANEPGPPVP
jgi:hypothetical protein